MSTYGITIFCECFQRNCITLKFVLSNENFSDILTKTPRKLILQKFRSYLFGVYKQTYCQVGVLSDNHVCFVKYYNCCTFR